MNDKNTDNDKKCQTIDYDEVLKFAPTDGTQIQREVISDTYVASGEEGQEDAMMERLSMDAEVLKHKTRGLAGYFSFCYTMMVLFYNLEKYDSCISMLDKIEHGINALDGYVLTGKFLDDDGGNSSFVNFSFGEDADELSKTMKYVTQTYNMARMAHMKASSFETGFSFTVASMMLHGYTHQVGMMAKDAKNFRTILEHMKKFLEMERNKPKDEVITSSADTTFGSIEDLKIE